MSILEMSAAGGLLILAAALLRAAALNRLPKGTFMALWGVAVLRLLLPIRLPSVFSVYTMAARLARGAEESLYFAADAVNHTLPGQAAAQPSGAVPAAVSPAAAAAAKNTPALWWWIWLAGALLCGVFFLTAYLRCRREFRTALPVQDERLRLWMQGNALRRAVRLRQTDRVRAPLTYGVLRPVILLPSGIDGAAPPEMTLVLEHEMAHIRHLDALWKQVLVLTACMHWFNPLVWWMLVLAEKDMELRCDEEVLRRAGGDRRGAYARTLLSMEERKAGLWPLASAFGKNAVEERILSIMKYKRTSLAAAAAAAALVLCFGLGFATTAAARDEPPRPDPRGGGFTPQELDWLAGLWFDGYEELTVAEYQQKMWEGRDTPEAIALIDRYGWYLARPGAEGEEAAAGSNAFDAYFREVYEPLTAEGWQKCIFSGSVGDCMEDGTAVQLEYTCFLRILDPETLTVARFRQTRADVERALAAMAGEYLAAGPSKLAKESGMQDIDFSALAETLSTEQLKVDVSGGVLVWSFTPLNDGEKGDLDMGWDAQPSEPGETVDGAPEDTPEQREFPQAGQSDYDAFFAAVQLEGWQQMSLAEFDRNLLDWANENSAAYDRINCDVIWDDYGAALTEEQKCFVSLTCNLSGLENAMSVRALYTRKPEEAVRICANMPFRLLEERGAAQAWCDLYYDLSYRVADKNAVTVAERDACVEGMLAEITRFWQETELETLLRMTEGEIVEQFRLWAARHSTDKVWFEPVTVDDIQFEAMDERGITRQ